MSILHNFCVIESAHSCQNSDPTTSLALSSRNAYLTPFERASVAPTLYAALVAARTAWEVDGLDKAGCIAKARSLVEQKAEEFAAAESVAMKLDYVEMNDPDTFDVLPDDTFRSQWEAEVEARPVILSGAMWLGEKKTRLIDNIVMGNSQWLGILLPS